MNLLTILTFLPPLVIILYIIKSDKFAEPINNILHVFFVGVFLCVPAIYLNEFFISDMRYSYIAGITEESLKFLAFIFFIKKNIQFNEKMDALVYGVLISLGFATYENFSYVYLMAFSDPLYVASMRMIGAIPLHAMCGVIMGYYLGIHYFTQNNNCLLKALLIPISIHATYNYLTDFGGLWFIFIFILFFFVKPLHKEFVMDQLKKTTEAEKKTRE